MVSKGQSSIWNCDDRKAITKCVTQSTGVFIPKGGRMWGKEWKKGKEKEEEKAKNTILCESLPLCFQGLANSKQLHDQ